MKKMYNLYTDVSLVKGDHIILLSPFLGDPDTNKNHPQYGRFARFQKLGKGFLNLTDSPSESDFFVYPRKWEKNSTELRAFLELAKKYKKKTLIFFNDDSDEDLGLDSQSTVVFRTSFYKSRKADNELAFPGWSPDYGPQPYRSKSEKPTVGFCGCYNNNHCRIASLRGLNNSNDVVNNFILYDRFWAGWCSDRVGKENYEYAQDARNQFIENMKHSDYILCPQGSGNFSYRLYESLCVGRIPIIIDTDIVLPHEEMIPWRDISVWVESKDIATIATAVSEDYKDMSEGEFLERQKTCRKIYEDNIRPTDFFKQWFDDYVKREETDD